MHAIVPNEKIRAIHVEIAAAFAGRCAWDTIICTGPTFRSAYGRLSRDELCRDPPQLGSPTRPHHRGLLHRNDGQGHPGASRRGAAAATGDTGRGDLPAG